MTGVLFVVIKQDIGTNIDERQTATFQVLLAFWKFRNGPVSYTWLVKAFMQTGLSTLGSCTRSKNELSCQYLARKRSMPE